MKSCNLALRGEKKNEKSIQNYSSDSEAPQFPPAHPKLATTPI